ncbi:FAD-dependent monooxygenase [Novosphingobium sp. MMS21-SN21R]|uniref:FAD-dependent monooxygenase n=1 Tax=Novosphingobium sp. MMS21-SN21R TaxID=2969298 RepID=UPI0028872EA9|nr:FAD-dependent monooxygenase [Novosphingobium sp. MMS21-SN21R]MDT0510243.1 FAD-dependent monooxygenase [Novosphingobium sp. MMS21-SN21R]
MSEKVLIVGGGIGGLSTAIALQQRGVNVEVVEVNKTWKVYHVGIIVQSNFVRALAQLGVAKEAVDAGFSYRGWRWRHNDTGQEMGRSEGVSTADGFPSDLGLARPALHDVLYKRVNDLGIKLRLGVTYSEIQDHGDKVEVSFTDGTSDSYDLVVGADGAYSKLRDQLFGDQHRPEFTGQGVWRYNLPRPSDLEWADAYITDPHQSIGTVPLTEDTMYIFVTASEPGNPRFAPETLADEMRKRLIGKGQAVEAFAAYITDPALVVYRPLEVCFLPKPWNKGRIVLIGDASHSSTPHLGQGAAMAVEDAVVLAEEIVGDRPIDERLARFVSRRFDRAKFIADQSRQLGAWQMNPTPDADPAGLFDRVRTYIGEPI